MTEPEAISLKNAMFQLEVAENDKCTVNIIEGQAYRPPTTKLLGRTFDLPQKQKVCIYSYSECKFSISGKWTNKHEIIQFTVIELRAQQALELETKEKQELICAVTVGRAEMFGTPLKLNTPYHFGPLSKIYIYTYEGCSIPVFGKDMKSQIHNAKPSNDNRMRTFLEHSNEFQIKREAAKADPNTNGPVIMVVGNQNSGKSTLCRILLNYAVRRGSTPIYVELDVGQNGISIPGTIGAVVVEHMADIKNGFSFDKGLVYCYGYNTPGKYIELYQVLMERLALAVNTRMANDVDVRSSGVIINTFGWFKGPGHDCLVNACKVFNVNFVLGFSKFSDAFQDIGIKKLRLMDVKQRKGNSKDAKKSRAERLEWYFGPKKDDKPIRVRSDLIAPHYIDPDGKAITLLNINNHKDLLDYIFAVSYLPAPQTQTAINPGNVIKQSICGFVIPNQFGTITDGPNKYPGVSLVNPRGISFAQKRILFKTDFKDDRN